jgi:transaldolase/glucose-6-phosphate isomerase
MNRLKELQRLGQSVWIDYIRRSLMTDGELQRLIREDGVTGLTSNPAIFEKAIGSGAEYRQALEALKRVGQHDAEQNYEALAIEDIRLAADQMRPAFAAAGGADGFVSFEVSPALAHDTQGTAAAARRLWQAVDRPNLMIKVPATREGIAAIEQLIAEGLNVNVTLLFAVEVYARVADAYLRGLERRLAAGQPIAGIASVASFFVSRIDSRVDPELEKLAASKSGSERDRVLALRGKTAIANAKMAYRHFQEFSAQERWRRLAAHGARPQRLLWASTSTKNPAYRETVYVEELIGPDTVNTMPPATLDAFRTHGRPARTLDANLDQARETLAALQSAGIDLHTVTSELLDEGVRLFAEAFSRLLGAVNKARQAA